MRGGKREGAGRPNTGTRPQHQVRAWDYEWDVISPFIQLVKAGCIAECQAAIEWVKTNKK